MKTFLITTLSGLFLLILSGLAWVAGDNPEAFLRLHDKLQSIFRVIMGIPIALIAANWLLQVILLPNTTEKLASSESENLEDTISELLSDAKDVRQLGLALLVVLSVLITGEAIFLSLTVISEAMNPEFYKALS